MEGVKPSRQSAGDYARFMSDAAGLQHQPMAAMAQLRNGNIQHSTSTWSTLLGGLLSGYAGVFRPY